MPTPQAICVLGMHRSGTSCVTGLLEDAGVFLGNVSKQNPHNRKGNQENKAIMQLHDAVLAANGGSWDAPPQGAVRWDADQRAALQTILQHYQGRGPWAFKDPRSLFTLSAWQDAIPGLKYVGTFRHPGAVAQSLYRRGGIAPEKGFELWRRYNERLAHIREQERFGLLCFDLDPEPYMHAVRDVFTGLGLDAGHTAFAFFEERLRNVTIEPAFATPPREVLDLYSQLRSLAA